MPVSGIVISGGAAVPVQGSPYASVREAIVDVRRQLEDALYINLSAADRETELEASGDERRVTLRRVRRMRRGYPLAKQAANLLQHYVIGAGVSLRANNKALVARIVDEFWDSPVNQAVFTSHRAMKRFLDRVYTDGEVFLVLFPDRDEGTLELGMLDAGLVDEVITDPENGLVPMWYRARLPGRKYDWASDQWDISPSDTVVYYRDWQNDRSDFAPPTSKQKDGLIYHVAINQQGKRGESELAAALDWVNAHRRFMEDRATLNRAAAQVAWKKKRKGTAADVRAEVERIQSTLAAFPGTRGYDGNPTATAGTVVENDASDLQWVKTDTGGTAAASDEKGLRMMVGSGLGGIPNHYFGDEANANLATATSMELPLLKTYEDWRTLLASVIHDLIDFQLAVAHEAGRIGPRDDSRRYAEKVTTPAQVIAHDEDVQEAARQVAAQMGEALGANPGVSPGAALEVTMLPKVVPEHVTDTMTDTSGAIDWYVDVDFPPIVEKDLGTFATSLKALYEMLPANNIESQKLVVAMFLTTLGVNDVDEVMEKIFPPNLPNMVNPSRMAAAMMSGLMGMQAARNGDTPEGTPNPKPDTEAESEPPKMAEVASLAEARVLRLYRAARAAGDALDRAAQA